MSVSSETQQDIHWALKHIKPTGSSPLNVLTHVCLALSFYIMISFSFIIVVKQNKLELIFFSGLFISLCLHSLPHYIFPWIVPQAGKQYLKNTNRKKFSCSFLVASLMFPTISEIAIAPLSNEIQTSWFALPFSFSIVSSIVSYLFINGRAFSSYLFNTSKFPIQVLNIFN